MKNKPSAEGNTEETTEEETTEQEVDKQETAEERNAKEVANDDVERQPPRHKRERSSALKLTRLRRRYTPGLGRRDGKG